jgi:hypothetical protein
VITENVVQKLLNIPLLRVAAAFSLIFAAPFSSAHGVNWSLSIGAPGIYAPPVIYAAPPPVVYVQPEPVYVRPGPVYVQPAPVVVYSRPYYQGYQGRYWRREHHHGRHGRFHD